MMMLQSKKDTAFGFYVTISTVIHLAVFLLLYWWGVLFPPNLAIQETYYVDVVNLPVAAPRSGSPVQKGDDREAPPPPAPESRMTVPTEQKVVDKGKKTTEKTKAAERAEADALAKKMAKLQEKAESLQQEAAMERLRRSVATNGKGRSGMPVAGGTEAGSSYNDYIKSRLEDALKKTISYSTKNPIVRVRLVIATDGRITRQKIESSSGDRTFELAVLRAIDIAGEKFPPPPNRKVFESGFIFKPRGITTK